MYILNRMESKSTAMMSELRKFQKILKALGVKLDTRWIPLEVNRYSDPLSWTSNSGNFRVLHRLLRSIQDYYRIDSSDFLLRSMHENRPACLKKIWEKMKLQWGDGKESLWNPPLKLLSITVRKIDLESALGVLISIYWEAQDWLRDFVDWHGKSKYWTEIKTDLKEAAEIRCGDLQWPK